jgi:hypothetical protein
VVLIFNQQTLTKGLSFAKDWKKIKEQAIASEYFKEGPME